jgi:hypothetical protein
MNKVLLIGFGLLVSYKKILDFMASILDVLVFQRIGLSLAMTNNTIFKGLDQKTGLSK